MSKWLGFGSAALMVAVLAVVFLTHGAVQYSTTTNTDGDHINIVASPLAPAPSLDERDGKENGPEDFLGNPVSDAVAEYKVDPTGTPYEVHSPQTELPKLRSPRS